MIDSSHISRMSGRERQFLEAFLRKYPDKEPHFYDWQLLTDRRWRYDFVWCYGGDGVALEIQGGIWQGNSANSSGHKSGHNSGNGILRDIDKLNHAQLAGYIALQVPGHLVAKAEYLDVVARAVEIKRAQYKYEYGSGGSRLTRDLANNTRTIPNSNLDELASEIF